MSRSAAIGILVFPPTLMPRRRATYLTRRMVGGAWGRSQPLIRCCCGAGVGAFAPGAAGVGAPAWPGVGFAVAPGAGAPAGGAAAGAVGITIGTGPARPWSGMTSKARGGLVALGLVS